MSDLATPASPAIDVTASPLVLCDRLIALARQADSAGYPATASQLVQLAHTMFDDKTAPAGAAAERRSRLC
jgi:hypothetical protein